MVNVKLNSELNGIEIAFDSVPTESTRNGLKSNGFRWHKVKKVWYAKQTADRLTFANSLTELEEITSDSVNDDFDQVFTTERTDAYMGAIGFKGSKSHLHLYGSNLSKAIRDDFKKYGITKCSVKCSTYSGGQSISVTVKVVNDDFISFEEYASLYTYESMPRFIFKDENDNNTYCNDFYFELSASEQKKVLMLNARKNYDRFKKADSVHSIYTKSLDDYMMFKPAVIEKIRRVQQVLDAYNHDDSNGMYDYFDHGFYDSVYTKFAE